MNGKRALTSEEEATLLAAVADRWPGPPVSEVDRMARLLIATWEKVEHTTVTAGYVASFADMARMVVSDTEKRVHDARESTGLMFCFHGDDPSLPSPSTED
jgi:hypothetical protein